MRLVLQLSCIFFTIVCFVFPFVYTHSDEDKKEMKISHILVETEEEAAKIREEIISKEKTFEEAAEQYSICESKAQKGDIGYDIKNGALLKSFTDRVFKMERFEVSEPFKTEVGWHIAKIYDIKYYSDKDNFTRKYF